MAISEIITTKEMFDKPKDIISSKEMFAQPSQIIAEPLVPEEIEAEEKLQWAQEKAQWAQDQIATGQIKPTEPTFWQRFKQELPQTGGATAGALAFERAARPLTQQIPHPLARGATKLGAALTGAFVGGMGGKGWQQTYQQVTRPTAKPMTLKEIYTEQAIAGIEEAAAELIGRGIAKVGAKALAPLKKRLLPGASRLSKELLRRGAHLTPAQMTESRIIDTLEGMAEKSFLGGGKLQRIKTIIQPEAYAKYIDDVVKQIGRGTRRQLAPEDVGELLLDTISGKQAAFKATAKTAYAKVDKLAGRAQVSLVPLKNFAKRTMQTAAKRKGIGSTQAGDTLLKKVLKLDDVISFRQAQALRSAFLDEKFAMSATRDKALGLTKQFIHLTDGAMEQGAKELSPEAYKAWRIANKFYRTGSETFNKKIIKTLTKNLAENPEIAVKKIFRPGATEQIKVIKNLVDEKTWTILKEGYLEQMLTEAADVDKIVLGKSFLQKLNRIGEPALKEVYGGEELRAIRSIGKLGQMLQRPIGGSGGMLIQLMQAGAVVNMGRMALGGTPKFAGESVTIVIGPPVLSRMLANPTWSKWLSAGIKLPRGTPMATVLAARLIKTTGKIQSQIRKEKAQQVLEQHREFMEKHQYGF